MNDNDTVYYNWEKKEDSAYFAFYTNQALNNAEIVLGHIEQVVTNKQGKVDDNKLWSNSAVIKLLENKNGDENKQQYAIEKLEEFMPFAEKPISKDKHYTKKIADRLSYFLFLLKEFRNQFSHYTTSKLNKSTAFIDYIKEDKKNNFPCYKFSEDLKAIKVAA